MINYQSHPQNKSNLDKHFLERTFPELSLSVILPYFSTKFFGLKYYFLIPHSIYLIQQNFSLDDFLFVDGVYDFC